MENTAQTPNYKRKSRKTTGIIIGVVALAIIIGAALYVQDRKQQATGDVDPGAIAVTAIAQAFGASFKQVSLQAPTADVATAMDIHYRPFVTSELLLKWKNNPTTAPGRLTSSPYPEKMEVLSAGALSKKVYRVVGKVSEVANGSNGSLQVVATYPLVMHFEKFNGSWLITSVEKGPVNQIAQ